jgi:hypothetical protein
MVTNYEDQKDLLKPGRQRREGGQQEALGRVVQVLNKREGRLIPVVRVDRSNAAGPGSLFTSILSILEISPEL